MPHSTDTTTWMHCAWKHARSDGLISAQHGFENVSLNHQFCARHLEKLDSPKCSGGVSHQTHDIPMPAPKVGDPKTEEILSTKTWDSPSSRDKKNEPCRTCAARRFVCTHHQGYYSIAAPITKWLFRVIITPKWCKSIIWNPTWIICTTYTIIKLNKVSNPPRDYGTSSQCGSNSYEISPKFA